MHYANNNIEKNTTNNKEYKVAQGKYEMYWETCWIDRKPFRGWKLYRKKQYRNK